MESDAVEYDGEEVAQTQEAYMADAIDERRRQYCLALACEYFSSQSHDKTVKAAEAFDLFLREGRIASISRVK